MVNRAQLTMTKGPEPGKTFPLEKTSIVLGRDPRNAIVVGHPQVSRKHARIVRRENTWMIEDLESTNGTFVNGSALIGSHVLSHGDVVSLSIAVELSFREEPDTVGHPPRHAARRPHLNAASPSRHPQTDERATLIDRKALDPVPAPSKPPMTRAAPKASDANASWTWFAVAFMVLLLVAACATVLILDRLELLPTPLIELLRQLGLF